MSITVKLTLCEKALHHEREFRASLEERFQSIIQHEITTQDARIAGKADVGTMSAVEASVVELSTKFGQLEQFMKGQEMKINEMDAKMNIFLSSLTEQQAENQRELHNYIDNRMVSYI